MSATTKDGQEIFYCIPRNVLLNNKLNATDMKIYAILKSFMSSTGHAFPSDDWLSKEIIVDERSVRRSIKKLCDLNILTCFKKNGVRYLTDSFIIHPEDSALIKNKTRKSAAKVIHNDKKYTAEKDKVVRNLGQSCPESWTTLSKTNPHSFNINNINYVDKNICQVSSTSEQPKATAAQTKKTLCRASPTVLSQNSSADVLFIFEHWKSVMSHPRSTLDDKRRSRIKKALADGYSVSDICAAVDGCKNTKFNMGDNDRREIYDGLHVILKNSDQIDRFIRNKNRLTVCRSDDLLARNAEAAKKFIEEVRAGESA